MRGSLPWFNDGILKSVARSDVDNSAPAFDQTRAELFTISMISVGPTAICVSGGVAPPFRRPSIDDPELIRGAPAPITSAESVELFRAAGASPERKWLGAMGAEFRDASGPPSDGCVPSSVA